MSLALSHNDFPVIPKWRNDGVRYAVMPPTIKGSARNPCSDSQLKNKLLHQWAVLFLLSVTPAISSVRISIRAQCKERATLPCTATRQEQHNYRAVSWYKMISETNQMGIIRKSKGDVRLYKGFDGSVLITEGDSLTIVEVTEADAGVYRCSLSASLGGINQDGDVNLSVCLPPDSVTQPVTTSLGPPVNVSQLVTSWPLFCLCVPPTVPFVGYLSLAAVLNIIKGLACYCSIWVLRKLTDREHHTRQGDVNVKQQMVQSLSEHIQRFSMEKHRGNSGFRTQIVGS
ncbi:uncharacterized protein [Scyliorhinus torazame]|uniref:uncharacterized protein n=1 Tax=Scyliorhinus torazame TaxID=75743 RepID=UPI003B5C99ED